MEIRHRCGVTYISIMPYVAYSKLVGMFLYRSLLAIPSYSYVTNEAPKRPSGLWLYCRHFILLIVIVLTVIFVRKNNPNNPESPTTVRLSSAPAARSLLVKLLVAHTLPECKRPLYRLPPFFCHCYLPRTTSLRLALKERTTKLQVEVGLCVS